jgi:hypothetical protein
MRFTIVAVFIALMSIVFAPVPCMADFGTRAEAVAMVKRVQAKINKDGLEATFRAINSGSKEFVDRDLYPFIFDFTGVVRANAQTAAVIGKEHLRYQGSGRQIHHPRDDRRVQRCRTRLG